MLRTNLCIFDITIPVHFQGSTLLIAKTTSIQWPLVGLQWYFESTVSEAIAKEYLEVLFQQTHN